MSVSVARTILNQLGGSKFVAMTGAKDFVEGDNALSFRIGRNASKANKVRVTFQANDLYRVEMFQLRGIDCKTTFEARDLEASQMVSFFERNTGLRTSL